MGGGRPLPGRPPRRARPGAGRSARRQRRRRPAADGRGPFDLVFIDADKRSNPEYLDWALRLTRVGSLILADNVVRDGAVADAASEDPSVVGVRRFLDLVAAQPRLTATAIQTVGAKGHDGLALALVTG